MKTAAGSCLLNSMSEDQLESLKEVFATFTPEGWMLPDWLYALVTEVK